MSVKKKIFCFYGPEDFLIEREIDSLKVRMGKDFGSDPDIERYGPGEISVQDLVAGLCTASLFGGPRIAVLSDFEEEDILKVLSCGKDFPDPVEVVVLLDKLDKRTKFFSVLSAEAVVKEFKPFAEWETKKTVDFIVSMARERGRSITAEAAALLNEMSGPSLRQLASEIEKLAAYTEGRGDISKDDIKALAVSSELGAFALENAVAGRDLNGALRALDSALRSKQPPHVLIGRLASRIRPYLMIKAFKSTNMPDSRIIQSLGMNPYYYERCLEGSSLYSLDDLVRAVDILGLADIAVKYSSSAPRITLEMALVEMMGGNR